ncbi:MAG: LamG domain-containing protein [Luteolibacter sp.]
MKKTQLAGGLAVLALCQSAFAANPTTLYRFETANGTTTPETMSVGANVANLGPAATIAGNSRRLGIASLRVAADRSVTGTAAATDAAVTSNTYSWPSSDVRTIAFWMRANPKQPHASPTMIDLGATTTTGARFDIRLDLGTGTDGNLRLEVQGGFVCTTAADFTTAGLSFTSLRDNRWHHVAVVVPNVTTTVRSTLFYIDGVPVSHSNQGTDAAINTAAGPLRIGDSYWDATRNFNGYLDDVRMYDVALTAQEALDLYNEGVANASAIAAFDAAAEIFGPGDSTSLTWDVTNGITIAIDHDIGDVSAQTSVTTQPSETPGTVTYLLTVTTPTGTETAELTLTALGSLSATTPAISGTNLTFTASNLVPGRTYQAEYQIGSLDGTWTPLGATFTGPLSTTKAITDAAASVTANPRAFYRVRQLP